MRITGWGLGCLAMGLFFWTAAVPADGSGGVSLCHMPPENPEKAHVIRVHEGAAQAHLTHGDVLGACPIPYSSCGWIVQDLQCRLFEDDEGRLLVLNRHGTTRIGERAQVTGTLDPDCSTSCEQADGCILRNGIAPCEESCSPRDGCPSPLTSCMQETGVCDLRGPGTCTPVPQSCPAFGTQVCGCDGITYRNACFAAMMGVSISFPGACSQEACTPRDGCPAGMFCSQPVGVCDLDEIGACATPPDDLGCSANYDPVCGCDGVTYDWCDAIITGVNLECFGECPCL